MSNPNTNEHNDIPEALKVAPQPAQHDGIGDGTDWRAEAQFWQLKYFELLIHTTQTITALSRPMLAASQLQQLQAQAKMMAAQG